MEETKVINYMKKCYDDFVNPSWGYMYSIMNNVDMNNKFCSRKSSWTTQRFRNMMNCAEKYGLIIPPMNIDHHGKICIGYLTFGNNETDVLIYVNYCIKKDCQIHDDIFRFVSAELADKLMGRMASIPNKKININSINSSHADITIEYINAENTTMTSQAKHKHMSMAIDTPKKRTKNVLFRILKYVFDIYLVERFFDEFIKDENVSELDAIGLVCSINRPELHKFIGKRRKSIVDYDKDTIINIIRICKNRKIAGTVLITWGIDKIDNEIYSTCINNNELGKQFTHALLTHLGEKPIA